MEFGIFNAACLLPKYRALHGDTAEHDRIMDEVAFIVAADKAGFKYTWASEHHFLTDYSHLSASESFLAFVAAKIGNAGDRCGHRGNKRNFRHIRLPSLQL